MAKEARIYNGQKTAFETNGVGKTRQKHTQKPSK